MRPPSRGRGGRAAPLLALALFLGCAPQVTPSPSRPSAPPAREATQRPPHGPRMQILDLREVATEAPGWVIVVGWIANGGDRTSEELRITVNALGAGDRVVTSSPAVPRSQAVPPGRRTDFAAAFERRPDVDAYHVKVLAW